MCKFGIAFHGLVLLLVLPDRMTNVEAGIGVAESRDVEKIRTQSGLVPDTGVHDGLMPPLDKEKRDEICSEVGDAYGITSGPIQVFKIPNERLLIGFLCTAQEPYEIFLVKRVGTNLYSGIFSGDIASSKNEKTDTSERRIKAKYDSGASGSGSRDC